MIKQVLVNMNDIFSVFTFIFPLMDMRNNYYIPMSPLPHNLQLVCIHMEWLEPFGYKLSDNLSSCNLYYASLCLKMNILAIWLLRGILLGLVSIELQLDV